MNSNWKDVITGTLIVVGAAGAGHFWGNWFAMVPYLMLIIGLDLRYGRKS